MVAGLLLGVAMLLAVLAVPMVRGSLPPNHWYGFRTPRIVADERLWYPANAMAGRVLWMLAALMGLAGALYGLGLLTEVGLMVAVVPAPILAVASMFYRASVMAAALDAPDVAASPKEESPVSEPPRAARPRGVEEGR